MLNFKKLGDKGPPLLVLHGWGRSLQDMNPLGALLSADSVVYLLDLPGFGESEIPSLDWNTLDYAKAVLAFMDEQGISKADVLGHSFGGRLALHLASRWPERVRKVVLVASAGIQRRRSLSKRIRYQSIKLFAKVLKILERLSGLSAPRECFSKRFGSADYKAAGKLRPILVRAVNEDLSNEAAGVKAQTLLLWGEKDCETPLAMGQRLNELIRDSKLIVLPGKGHEPFLSSGAHLCTTYIRRFLDEEAQC